MFRLLYFHQPAGATECHDKMSGLLFIFRIIVYFSDYCLFFLTDREVLSYFHKPEDTECHEKMYSLVFIFPSRLEGAYVCWYARKKKYKVVWKNIQKCFYLGYEWRKHACFHKPEKYKVLWKITQTYCYLHFESRMLTCIYKPKGCSIIYYERHIEVGCFAQGSKLSKLRNHLERWVKCVNSSLYIHTCMHAHIHADHAYVRMCIHTYIQ
jgi:hypothetical protein